MNGGTATGTASYIEIFNASALEMRRIAPQASMSHLGEDVVDEFSG